jgi:DEAD/DEAH box helicase domain-containing protein
LIRVADGPSGHHQDVEVITEDGAPSGRRDFVIWNPPPVDPQVPCLGKHSSLSEATGLMRFLMKCGVRVILFCKVNPQCDYHIHFMPFCQIDPESLRIGCYKLSLLYFHVVFLTQAVQAMKTIRTDLTSEGRLDILERVMSYRGGE